MSSFLLSISFHLAFPDIISLSQSEEGGRFNAGCRRRGGRRVLISHQSESVLIIHQSSCSFFTQNHLDSPSKATPREEKGSRVQQPMRKSPALIGNTDFFESHSLSFSISGKIWHLSAMSHRPPPPLPSSSPVPSQSSHPAF